MNIKTLRKMALNKWGAKSQMDMATEEMAELIQALNKFHRAPSEKTEFNVCDEIVDVEMMLSQLKLIFDTDIINERRIFKHKRLEELLDEMET